MTMAMNAHDMITAMRADPALAEEMRAVVLDEELRSLPEIVRNLAVQVAANTKAIAELTVQVAANTKAIAELVEVTKLHGMRLDRIDGRISNLMGWRYEEQVDKQLRAIMGRVGPGFRRVAPSDRNEFADRMDEAVEAGRVSADEAGAVLEANSVATAQAKDDGREVYLVVESSITVAQDDVERARTRAAIIAQALDVDTKAVVVGSILPDGVDYGGVLPVRFTGKHIA